MQLLQTLEMFSWSLPKRWQIVATANPEGGDYSVTPMDDAMLTRMLHMTLTFDPKARAAWATRAGVDARGISFVLTYPESVTGRRTTARSLTQFFEQIRQIPPQIRGRPRAHAGDELPRRRDGGDLHELRGRQPLGAHRPQEILDAEDFKPIAKRVERLAETKGGGKRVDRLSTVCTRLALAVTRTGYAPGERHAENLVKFLPLKVLPNDLRVALHKDLLADGTETVRAMLRDKRLAELITAGM